MNEAFAVVGKPAAQAVIADLDLSRGELGRLLAAEVSARARAVKPAV